VAFGGKFARISYKFEGVWLSHTLPTQLMRCEKKNEETELLEHGVIFDFKLARQPHNITTQDLW